MLIAGTIPIKNLPLTLGKTELEGEFLSLNGYKIPCTQGTGALISAALMATNYLKIDPPDVLVAGDVGDGKGSKSIYEYLIRKVPELLPDVLVLHYCLPDMALTRELWNSVEKCSPKPILIADAASMYVAKAVGLALKFDIFTPDATEMAFLADPEATHPAYINKHLFDTDTTKIPKLVSTAYEQRNAAKLLLVKGAVDYIVEDGEILTIISEPEIPELEAIGGTGDTITGLVSAFVHAELELQDAAIIAAKSNRVAGRLAQATPATKVWEIVSQFPKVFGENLCKWSGVCLVETEI
jgi:NAD(P)H-hydrate repair Nnr-like enzyme with NAD(P)H-hydrate dehydratase domain